MSMTLAPIETPSRTANSAKVELTEPAGSPSDRPAQSEFGQIMSGVLQSSPEKTLGAAGQEMAAVSDLQAGTPGSFGGNLSASLGGDFLKAVHLGPHMNVITSDAAVPDEQSLEAFARSQGLDETAVQWLMGSSPVVAVPSPMTATGSLGTLDGVTLVQAMNAASQTDGSTPEDALQAAAPSAPVQPQGAAPGNALNADSTGVDGKADGLFNPNALTAAALWAMAQGNDKAKMTPAAPEDPAEVAKVQINWMASPAPAAFWMLRNPMVAAPVKEALTTPSGVSQSEIDLSQSATPELLDSLSQALAEGSSLSSAEVGGEHPTPLSGHSGHRVDLAAAARQEAQNPAAGASAPDTASAQRSENIQNLAEKMGQAVGQRILSEIEKGQWHLKLSLRPATLGHIEVDMRMRSGELDAVFTAPQALTRELLLEGMSKLKDTLSQMGMDVASMQVGDGQTQKRGGESTPGQMSKSADGNSDDPQSSLSAVQAPPPPMKMGQDGWDVLV
ncbi:flagellar hook-length control protein FliK [Limnohabitans sp. G3-2]|uniref:flagellar hook-length control protein FliK n=1 Tax=Limnohabitans sp. G3-2 TaxID=1100711 RepID=UPI000C1F2DE9|nr:flagellar hook-length control protein FliK [Limnohabitans sp. G3-2]PIT74846.1 hypothetical protein B9Z31_07165 [Limnohabitans sp. G3-2]